MFKNSLPVGVEHHVVTLGRSSVDLYGEQLGGRLEDMSSFAKYVGGCPANIAVGTAKLGLSSAIITGVGNDHMGRFISEEFEAVGVSTEGVKVDSDRMTALVVLGIRNQETFPLIFYRENCADMGIGVEDVPERLVASSASLLVTGTHLSTLGTLSATKHAVSIAKAHGRKVIFDIDYRPVLWGLTSKDAGENRFVANIDVTEKLLNIAGDCDLIVGTEEEFHILGGTTDTIAALEKVRSISKAELVLKLGAEGCVVFKAEIPQSLSEGVSGQHFSIEVMNVLGAGDAFLSGYLSGWLNGMSTEECCRRANACGAIVVTRHGCAPAMPTHDELELFLSSGDNYSDLLDNGMLDQIHWSTTRSNNRSSLMAFAIDHRSQFDEMAKEYGTTDDRIGAAKQLAFDAFHRVAKGREDYGMLLDGRFARKPLANMSDYPYWIGRPIEAPGKRPLEFESSADVATELMVWPANHTVKCLVPYHPDDDPELRKTQDEKILQLYDACRKTSHEFLFELIASPYGSVDDDTAASAMKHFYDLGIYPDWWKLEPSDSVSRWKNISNTINHYDPYCRGVVVLGLSKPLEELKESLCAAAEFPIVRGFAVGRSIFEAPLRLWFKNEISDEEAISRMASNYEYLTQGWTEARREQPPQEVELAS